MKKLIYVTIDQNCEKGDDALLAWETIDSAEVGKVGVYELVEVIEKREVSEVRRPGSTKWFKPNGTVATDDVLPHHGKL